MVVLLVEGVGLGFGVWGRVSVIRYVDGGR